MLKILTGLPLVVKSIIPKGTTQPFPVTAKIIIAEVRYSPFTVAHIACRVIHPGSRVCASRCLSLVIRPARFVFRFSFLFLLPGTG